jgi:hypothetical protein
MSKQPTATATSDTNRTGLVESLFVVERELRESAVVYSSWQTRGDGEKETDRGNTDGARLRLRKAALAYAAVVRKLEQP